MHRLTHQTVQQLTTVHTTVFVSYLLTSVETQSFCSSWCMELLQILNLPLQGRNLYLEHGTSGTLGLRVASPEGCHLCLEGGTSRACPAGGGGGGR